MEELDGDTPGREGQGPRRTALHGGRGGGSREGEGQRAECGVEWGARQAAWPSKALQAVTISL